MDEIWVILALLAASVVVIPIVAVCSLLPIWGLFVMNEGVSQKEASRRREAPNVVAYRRAR